MTKYRIKSLAPEDAEAILDTVFSEENREKFRSLAHKPSLRDEEMWIKRMQNSQRDTVFKLVGGVDEKLLGIVGLHEIDWYARTGRIGVIIGEEGKGHGPNAIEKICESGFETLHLNKIWAIHRSDNQRMEHILLSKGFLEEGRLVNDYRDPSGLFHTMHRQYILAQTWYRSRS